MMKRSERENRIDSPYNWQAHYQLGKVDEEFTLSYTRCGLCELARKRGHLDILPAMCRTDYITFEAMEPFFIGTRPLLLVMTVVFTI